MYLITCARCGKQVSRPHRNKYCSNECYHAAPVADEARAKQSASRRGKSKPPDFGKKISAAMKGRPKPWLRGERNGNFGGRLTSDPDIRAKMRAAIKKRGQAWSKEDREKHSERMLGPSNKMRGRQHSAETKAAVSAAKLALYRSGSVKVRRWKVSKAEREIEAAFIAAGIHFKRQHWVIGLTYLYDFYLPDQNILLEYQGNYWHANPRRYPPDMVLKLGDHSMLASDIWARDARKKAEAEALGFAVVYVWEDDYQREGMEAVWQALR